MGPNPLETLMIFFAMSKEQIDRDLASTPRTSHPPLTPSKPTACYAVIRLAEGYGLWHAKHWAEWFAVISAGLYLPFELGHLVRRPTWLTSAVVVFNILLIIYLAKLLIDQRAARHRARLAAAQSGDPLITATPTAPVRKP